MTVPDEPIDDAYRPKVRDDLTSVVLDGEIVIYDEATASVHQLDPIATLLWPLMDGDSTLADLVGDVSEAFSAPPSKVRDDLVELLEHLRARRLLADRPPPARPLATPRKPGYLVDPPAP